MSRGLSNTAGGVSGSSNSSGGGFRAVRDYGATSSTSIPDVDFAGFSPTEFMSLSNDIAQNITSIKSSWQMIQKTIKIIGTSKDNVATRDKVQQIQSTTNSKIKTTSKDLQRLTFVVRRGDKQQKLQVDKLTNDFKMVFEMFIQSQQQIASKMKSINLTNASQNDDINRDNMSSAGVGANDSEQNRQMQQQLQEKQRRDEIEFESGMMIERARSVQQIEANILDVNEIMRDLSTMISQQGENIDTIESSIDHTTSNIESGTSELIKAAQSQAKYRRKVLILLAIAVIIGLIVTGIIVSQLKS